MLSIEKIDNSFIDLIKKYILKDGQKKTIKEKSLLLGCFNKDILEIYQKYNFQKMLIKNSYELENDNLFNVESNFNLETINFRYIKDFNLPFKSKTFLSSISLSNFYFINIEQAQIIVEEIYRVLIPDALFLVQFIYDNDPHLLRRSTKGLDQKEDEIDNLEICFYNEAKILRVLAPRFEIIKIKNSSIRMKFNGKIENHSVINVLASAN